MRRPLFPLALLGTLLWALPATAQAPSLAACTGADDPKAAIAACTAVLDTPGFLPAARSLALDARGYAYLQTGNAARALTDLDAAVALDPANAAALNDRGTLHAAAGALDLAIADFSAAIALHADAAYVRNRAEANLKREDFAKALPDLDGLVRAGIRDVAIVASRARARAVLGAALEVALGDCDAALRAQPNDPGILDTRALVHLKRAEYAAAIADEDAAIAASPRLASALFGRGIARTLAGAVGAAADFAAARAIDPQIGARYARWGLPGYENR